MALTFKIDNNPEKQLQVILNGTKEGLRSSKLVSLVAEVSSETRKESLSSIFNGPPLNLNSAVYARHYKRHKGYPQKIKSWRTPAGPLKRSSISSSGSSYPLTHAGATGSKSYKPKRAINFVLKKGATMYEKKGYVSFLGLNLWEKKLGMLSRVSPVTEKVAMAVTNEYTKTLSKKIEQKAKEVVKE